LSRSQHLRCLHRYLYKHEHIPLDESHEAEIRNDVELFLKSKIRAAARCDSWLEELRAEVTQEITERAKSVFLWAAFVVEELKECEVVEVKQALREFPKELEAVYLTHAAQHSSQPSNSSCNLAQVSARSLPAHDSDGAQCCYTRVEPAPTQTVENAVRDQIKFCNHLLEEHNGDVTVCHASARDYLLASGAARDDIPTEFRFVVEQVHQDVAEVCLQHSEACSSDLVASTIILFADFTVHNRQALLFPPIRGRQLGWDEEMRGIYYDMLGLSCYLCSLS
jgi:hypothetical protein